MDSEDSVIFCQDYFMSQSFAAFEDMRRNEEFVDFKLTFEKRCIMGHRLVLAARIPHFRMICRNPKEEEISLNEIDPDTLELIINFAYCGRIKITSRNVLPLLKATKVLQLTRVYDACWEFVERKFHSNNVLEIRKFAEDHLTSKYVDLADNYIRLNFEEFTNSKNFLTLPFQMLKKLISRDDIIVSTEEKVFEAVISWIKGSSSERRDLLPELLRDVRMCFLNPDFLIERVSTEELVRSSLPCRDLIEEAKNYHLMRDKKSKVCPLPSNPRIYQHYKAVLGDILLRNLYAVCCSQFNLSVKMLNCRKCAWSDIQVSPIVVKDVDAVAELNGIIYIFSVFNIFIFDLKNQKTSLWNIVNNPGNMKVSSSGFVSINRRIYFFGGIENESRKVRFFEPSAKTWFEAGSMTRHLHNPGVTSLGEHVYITGGIFANKTSKVVERYNPQKKRWNELSPLKTGRYSHGCCSLNDKIYVCGGFLNEGRVLNSAEMYDLKMNQWQDIAGTKEPLCKLSVVPSSGKLFAIGRRDKYSLREGNVEVYDPDSNEWTDIAPIPDVKKYNVYLISSEVK